MVSTSQPGVGCNARRHLCSVPISFRQALQQQTLRLRKAENTMTSGALSCLNQLQLRTRTFPLFWTILKKDLLAWLVTKRTTVVTPALVLGSCQRECCQHFDLHATMVWLIHVYPRGSPSLLTSIDAFHLLPFRFALCKIDIAFQM